MAWKNILSGTFEKGGFNICSTYKNVNSLFKQVLFLLDDYNAQQHPEHQLIYWTEGPFNLPRRAQNWLLRVVYMGQRLTQPAA